MTPFKSLWTAWSRLPFVHREVVKVDLGSSHTRVVIADKLIFDQPSCVVVHQTSGSVVAVGQPATLMLGKTPPNVKVSFPLAAELDYPQVVLFWQAVMAQVGRQVAHGLNRYTVQTTSLPTASTILTKAWSELFRHQGALQVQTEPAVVAAHRSLSKRRLVDGTACVLIFGHRHISIGLFAQGKVVVSQTIAGGGWWFIKTLQQQVRHHHQLEIGWLAAEQAMHQLAYLGEKEEVQLVVRGKHVITHLPTTQAISSQIVAEPFKVLMEEWLSQIVGVLAAAPAELMSEMLTKGITITGGMSRLEGLSQVLAERFKTEVSVSPTPDTDVVWGTGIES